MRTAPSRNHEREDDGEEVVNAQLNKTLAPAAAKTSSGSTTNTGGGLESTGYMARTAVGKKTGCSILPI